MEKVAVKYKFPPVSPFRLQKPPWQGFSWPEAGGGIRLPCYVYSLVFLWLPPRPARKPRLAENEAGNRRVPVHPLASVCYRPESQSGSPSQSPTSLLPKYHIKHNCNSRPMGHIAHLILVPSIKTVIKSTSINSEKRIDEKLYYF